VVSAEEIVCPRRGLIKLPVAGFDIFSLQGLLFTISLEPLVSPNINAFSFAGKNLAPAFNGTPAWSVEKKFCAL
jgi:hypothetical protein